MDDLMLRQQEKRRALTVLKQILPGNEEARTLTELRSNVLARLGFCLSELQTTFYEQGVIAKLLSHDTVPSVEPFNKVLRSDGAWTMVLDRTMSSVSINYIWFMRELDYPEELLGAMRGMIVRGAFIVKPTRKGSFLVCLQASLLKEVAKQQTTNENLYVEPE